MEHVMDSPLIPSIREIIANTLLMGEMCDYNYSSYWITDMNNPEFFMGNYSKEILVRIYRVQSHSST